MDLRLIGIFTLGLVAGILCQVLLTGRLGRLRLRAVILGLPYFLMALLTVMLLLYAVAVFGGMAWAQDVLNLPPPGNGDGTLRARALIMSPLAVGMSALIALCTYLVAQHYTQRNHRRQHTISLLFQNFFVNEYIQDKRGNFFRNMGNSSKLTRDFFHGKSDDARRAFYLLNYFENIAAAIHYGDLDEKLIRTTIGVDIMVLIARSADYIQWMRQGDGSTGGEPPSFLEHLVALYEDWYANLGADMRTFFHLERQSDLPVAPAHLVPVPADRRERW